MAIFCPFHSTMSLFWVASQFWMTQNYLDLLKIKSIYMHTTYTSEAQFSSASLYDQPLQSHAPFSFSKSTLNDPNFRPFRSTMSRFWVMAQFLEKVHQMTPNDLDVFKVKNTNMHVTYTPDAQIFICFALQWAVFESPPNFQKSALNGPKWPWHVQGQKYQHVCYIHPWGPNFHPFRFTMSRFWVMT